MKSTNTLPKFQTKELTNEQIYFMELSLAECEDKEFKEVRCPHCDRLIGYCPVNEDNYMPILKATHTLLNLLFFLYCGVLVKTAPDISPAKSIYMGIAINIGINTEARIAVIIESVIYELPF